MKYIAKKIILKFPKQEKILLILIALTTIILSPLLVVWGFSGLMHQGAFTAWETIRFFIGAILAIVLLIFSCLLINSILKITNEQISVKSPPKRYPSSNTSYPGKSSSRNKGTSIIGNYYRKGHYRNGKYIKGHFVLRRWR